MEYPIAVWHSDCCDRVASLFCVADIHLFGTLFYDMSEAYHRECPIAVWHSDCCDRVASLFCVADILLFGILIILNTRIAL